MDMQMIGAGVALDSREPAAVAARRVMRQRLRALNPGDRMAVALPPDPEERRAAYNAVAAAARQILRSGCFTLASGADWMTLTRTA